MQKQIINYCLCLFFAMNFVLPSYAASSSSDLHARLQALHAFRAKFVQTTYSSQGKAIQKTVGEIAWQRPGKFRWHAEKPVPQLIIANGKVLWIVDPDLMQVTIRAVHNEAKDTPTRILSEDVSSIDKRFVVTTLPKQGNIVRYQLLPKASEAAFDEIILEFSNEALRGMRLRDSLGHRTNIVFNQIVINRDFPAGYFNYIVKQGMDVVDER